MLPPGHIAAGFLTAKALLHFAHPALSQPQQTELLWWGIFFGFAPDLDVFYLFFKSQALKMDPAKGNHRLYYGHAPILWIIPGLIIFFASQSPFWKMFGLLVWLGSWSHFILDSIQGGIMWLWPLNKKVYALYPVINQTELNADMHDAVKKSFFGYWVTFLKEYSKGLRITVVCEFILIIVTLIIYFK